MTKVCIIKKPLIGETEYLCKDGWAHVGDLINKHAVVREFERDAAINFIKWKLAIVEDHPYQLWEVYWLKRALKRYGADNKI